jgi:actin-related protein
MAEKKGKEQLESDIDVKDIVVIDNGTETTKMGFSGEDYPRVKF